MSENEVRDGNKQNAWLPKSLDSEVMTMHRALVYAHTNGLVVGVRVAGVPNSHAQYGKITSLTTEGKTTGGERVERLFVTLQTMDEYMVRETTVFDVAALASVVVEERLPS